jgi:hypothetical protein
MADPPEGATCAALARATTGDIDEYGTLTQRNVSPAATLELISWLAKALAPEPPK